LSDQEPEFSEEAGEGFVVGVDVGTVGDGCTGVKCTEAASAKAIIID
jgi:hypothetical protein